MRLGITASPSEIFPGGKVKYFLWKCDILLSQCEICLRHVKVSLRDDFHNKKEFRKNCGIPFFIHFFDRKNFIAKLFHTPPGVFHSFAKAKLFHCVMGNPYAHHAKEGGGPYDKIHTSQFCKSPPMNTGEAFVYQREIFSSCFQTSCMVQRFPGISSHMAASRACSCMGSRSLRRALKSAPGA